MITKIMASTECYISSGDNASRSSSRTKPSSILSSTSINDTTLCNCQQRLATNNCSSKEESCNSSNTIHRMPMSTSVLFITIFLVFLSSFTCCVSAWPILNHRRTYSYAPPSVAIPDYNELVDINQWALAAQPDAYYDALSALPPQQQQIGQDVLDDEYQIYDQYPEEETYPMPFFGPIVDPVEPEEELELEELKHQQPYVYEKRRPAKVTATKKPAALISSSSSLPTSTPASTESTPSSTASLSLSSSNSKTKVLADLPHVAAPLHKVSNNNGQKEIAMLRPQSAAKSHYIQMDEPEEPKISVAQRSPSNEKPSAYDRLRKYLSLDDALKKEYQQRRANAMNRHHSKRESISTIITDSDSLTGQLNHLKKKID